MNIMTKTRMRMRMITIGAGQRKMNRTKKNAETIAATTVIVRTKKTKERTISLNLVAGGENHREKWLSELPQTTPHCGRFDSVRSLLC
jgi:hypothetical protein